MNIPAIPPLISSILFIALGLFVFLKKPQSRANQTFGLMCLVTFWWQLSWFILFSFGTEKLAKIMVHIGYTGIIFIPYTFYHFFVTFLKKDKEKFLILCAYSLGFIFLFFNWTSDLFIKGYYKYSWGYYPKAGFLHPIYLLTLFSIAVRITYLLYKELREAKSSPFRYNQIKYILCAFVIYTFASFDFAENYGLKIYPMGFISITLSLSIMAYTIIKHRLMGIELGGRYALSYFFYGIVTLAIFIPIALFLKPFWVGLVTIFLSILAAPYFHRFWMRRFQPAFLGENYRTWQDLDKFKEIELGYISEQIAWNLVEGIAEIMQVDRLSFFMYIKNRKELRPQAQIGLDEEIGCEPIPFVVLRQENPLIRFLADSKGPLLKDELKESDLIAQEMQKVYAEVSIPVFVQNRLTGVLNLGPKPNQEMYHQEDIKKLTELCHQTENHLSHTLFMEERTSFSRELAHDMKNLFVKAIEPTVETILETTDPSRKDKEIKTLAKQLGYLNICLKDNFDLISLLEKIVYHKYTLEPVPLARVISTCVSLYKAPLVEKELSLELDISKDLPLVLLNKEDIPKVFNNLFDNSLKFTPRGGKITIKVERKENEVLVTFSDTGPGIEKEKLENIFEPEVKMPEETETGTGLGLVIVRDIIEAHKGSIRVESEKDRGTSFYFTLPIAKEGESAR